MKKAQHYFYDGPERRKNASDEAYFNAQFDAKSAPVKPGEMAISENSSEMFVANAGCGILLMLFDRTEKRGGLTYLCFPEAVLEGFSRKDPDHEKLYKASFAPLRACVDSMMEAGSLRENITIRLAGGAEIDTDDAECGLKSLILVKEYLLRRGFRLTDSDTGGQAVKRIHYFPATGRSVKRFLRRQGDIEQVLETENTYRSSIS